MRDTVSPPAVGRASWANGVVGDRRVLTLGNVADNATFMDVESRPTSGAIGNNVLDRLVRACMADLDHGLSGQIAQLTAVTVNLNVLNGDSRLIVAIDGVG